jgi:exosortase F-associated protein
MSRLVNYAFIALLLIGLAAVRFFEHQLFYDPLLTYFDLFIPSRPLPEIIRSNLFLSLAFRYVINMALSLGIIWFLYKRKDFIKASVWVYVLTGIILMLAALFLLDTDSGTGKMALFYVRRFLIQPIWLFVLVSGFYWLKRKQS